jgi:hypothetical protein
MVTGKLKRECLQPKRASINFSIILPTFHSGLGLVGLALLPWIQILQVRVQFWYCKALGSYE